MRELRGEMEMLRVEREQWESEAARERERREAMEDELRAGERQRREDETRRRRAEEEAERERTRADNLQEVLADFQSAKDLEIQQATSELESQLRQAVQSLAEWKTRAADAEVSPGLLVTVGLDADYVSLGQDDEYLERRFQDECVGTGNQGKECADWSAAT
jgi:hypothetical protein